MVRHSSIWGVQIKWVHQRWINKVVCSRERHVSAARYKGPRGGGVRRISEFAMHRTPGHMISARICRLNTIDKPVRGRGLASPCSLFSFLCYRIHSRSAVSRTNHGLTLFFLGQLPTPMVSRKVLLHLTNGSYPPLGFLAS